MQRNKSQHLYESIISNIDKSLKHLLNEQGNTQTTEFDPKRICAKIIRYQDKVTEDEIHYMNTLSNVANVGNDRRILSKIIKFYSEKFPNDSMNWLDVSKITDMSYLFNGKDGKNYNGDISKWNTSNVTDMSYMFTDSLFNQDISNWDVSHVRFMNGMFLNSEFDQDISGWDVSNVEDMQSMFSNSEFDQDISGWDVSNVKQSYNIFKNSVMIEKNKPKEFKYEPKISKTDKRAI